MRVQRFTSFVQNTDPMRPSALSFLTSRGALDNAGSWASLSDGDRAAVKAQYNAAGIKLIVSAFGSTETPTSSGLDPVSAATNMGNWVRQYGLDGIDVDYEVKTSHLSPRRCLANGVTRISRRCGQVCRSFRDPGDRAPNFMHRHG